MNEDLSTVQVDFSLAVGTGRLDASLPVPTGTVTLTQLLPVLQSLSSQIIGSTVQIVEKEGYQISCRAGCGACCRQLVPLSLFEAEALAGWIRTLPVDQQVALESRFHAALHSLQGAGILERLNPAGLRAGSPESKDVAIDYLAQRVPCPFLDVQTEACTIHPIRPMSCREYLVTSPPELCWDPSANPVVGVPVPIKLSKVLIKLGAMIEQQGSPGWIPLVFLFAWMRGDPRPGNAIAGPGPEVLQGVVQQFAKA